jgi:hypothetical protein
MKALILFSSSLLYELHLEFVVLLFYNNILPLSHFVGPLFYFGISQNGPL